MHFNEKLDLLLKTLSIKTTDLAQKVGVDASLISKLRTGARSKPTRHESLRALCKALAELYPDSFDPTLLPIDLQQRLQSNSTDTSDIESALLSWFEEDAATIEQGRSPSALRLFSEKFSALLEITRISNAQIARALNVDSSLISLYKNGVRLPAPKSSTVENISSFFARQKLSSEQSKALLETIECDDEPLDEAALQARILAWLSTLPKDYSGTESVESFLERVDTFGSFAVGKTVVPLEQIKEQARDGSLPAVLFGHTGIQQAAITYLAYVASQESPQKLHHFSDQSTEWMLGNPEFTRLWASLMVHVLSKGTSLRIIHTVNRDSSELFSALENWIPLYMIGEIIPYYFRSGSPGRFRISQFLAEDLALISGYCSQGAEDRAIYRYDTESHITSLAKEQFDVLLSECGELMKIFKGQKDTERYRIHLNAFWGSEGDVTTFVPRLSLATIPEPLLTTKLEHLQIAEQTKRQILESQAKQLQALQRQLSKGMLRELCVMESTVSVSQGAVYLDIPPNVLAEPLAYTVSEYQAHLDHIKTLEEALPSYRFYPLYESPFSNIKLYCKHNGRSIVEKLSEPTAAFSFDNPHMCRGIAHFLGKLEERAKAATPEKPWSDSFDQL